jgi:phage portal protein BeeE
MTSLLADAFTSSASVVSAYQKAVEARGRQLADLETAIAERPTQGNISFSNDNTGERYRHFKHWVYVAVDKISSSVAALPWRAAELTNAPENPERRQSDFRQKIPQQINCKAIGGEEFEALASHPALDLLAKPNNHQSSYEFLYFTIANLEITGKAYWILGTDETGTEERLFAVPSNWMSYDRKNDVYLLQVAGSYEKTVILPEYVATGYFPNPSDPLGCYSPLSACISAIQVDDWIQSSQAKAFERGIFPNVIVTVGKGNRENRPTLTGPQRRQYIRAVNEVWSQTVNIGAPAIVDGLIDSVQKLHLTPQEMDWQESGEIVKKRIIQTYGINPYVFGEVTGVNRAQAAVAKEQFYETVINPLAGLVSNAMTEFLGPRYEQPKRLVLYLEEAKAIDREQRLREWSTLRRTDDVTQEEYRQAILGLAPLEERDDPSALLSLVGGLNGITNLQVQVSQGLIGVDEAVAVLVNILRVPEDIARQVVGDGPPDEPEPPPEPEPQPVLPPPEVEEVEDDEEVDDEKSFSSSRDKADVLEDHVKRFTKAEEDMSQSLARYFLGQLDKDCRQN